MKEEEVVKRFLKRIGSEGGKARAARHDRATLSKWAKLGGRPRKKKGKTKRTA